MKFELTFFFYHNQYTEFNRKWNDFIEIEIKESNILKIEISWGQYNFEQRETLSNQRHFH